MSVTLALLGKEIKWLWRSYRLVSLIAVFLVLGIGGPLLLYFLPDLIKSSANDVNVTIPDFTSGDAAAAYFDNLNQMGVIGVILVTMGAVAGERATGAAVFTLSKPVSFFNYVLAKYLTLLALLAVATIAGGIAAYIYSVALFGALNAVAFIGGMGLMLLEMAVMLAITLVGSCLSRSQLLAGGVALAAVIMLGVFGAVPVIREYSPFGLASWAGGMLRAEHTGPAWYAFGISVAIALLGPYAGARILAAREL